jgi:hypothetical protein
MLLRALSTKLIVLPDIGTLTVPMTVVLLFQDIAVA